MTAMQRKVLQQIIEAGGEPLLVARVDQADWPVVMTNPAFDSLSGLDVPLLQVPMTDVIEKLHGRDAAQESAEYAASGPGIDDSARVRATQLAAGAETAGNRRQCAGALLRGLLAGFQHELRQRRQRSTPGAAACTAAHPGPVA
ncbi:MAG: hypothetical protein U5K38_05480 [Woeseiaceae bacterium]|nr:hypothetical protein [Woeseiaceae bacterium]